MIGLGVRRVNPPGSGAPGGLPLAATNSKEVGRQKEAIVDVRVARTASGREREATGPSLAPQNWQVRRRRWRRSRRLALPPDRGGHHGARVQAPDGSSPALAAASLKGPTGLRRARQEGLAGGLQGEHDEEHAARQAHDRARLSFHKEGRAFTRLASHATRSKACARASVFVSPAAMASGGRPRPGRRRARRRSALRAPITRA